MYLKNNDPDEFYIRVAEECHSLLEHISTIFADQLLNVEDEISWNQVEMISEFRDRLSHVIESPIPIKSPFIAE